LEEHTRLLFPVLGDVKIAYRWGGPFSATLDLTLALGFLGDQRIVFRPLCGAQREFCSRYAFGLMRP